MSQVTSPKVGAARGAARPLEPTVGPWLFLDLDAQIDQLQEEPYWQSGRNSKTIVHYPDFRMVVTAMQANTTIHEHRRPDGWRCRSWKVMYGCTPTARSSICRQAKFWWWIKQFPTT